VRARDTDEDDAIVQGERGDASASGDDDERTLRAFATVSRAHARSIGGADEIHDRDG